MGNFSESVAAFAKSIPTWFQSTLAPAASAAASDVGSATATAAGKGGFLEAASKAANLAVQGLSGASALKMITAKPPKPPAPPSQPNPASILSNRQGGPGNQGILGGTYNSVQGAPSTGTKNLLGQ